MSHKAAENLEDLELELVEEKYKAVSKDILGLKNDSDLVLFNHIPELVNKIDLLNDNIIIIRDDHADTSRLVRKMYYDTLPIIQADVKSLNTKVDTLIGKVDAVLTLLHGFVNI